MAERNCDRDCLHSKVCESDYQEQVEEEAEAQLARDANVIPQCDVVFSIPGAAHLISTCQLERGHKGDHQGSFYS